MLSRQRLPAIELQGRRVAVDPHRDAAVRRIQQRGVVVARFQHQAMVVATGQTQLRIGRVGARGQGVGPAEIEGRAGHRQHLPQGDQVGRDRQHAAHRHLQQLARGRHRGVAGEVEIGMVGGVERRRRVARGLELEQQPVAGHAVARQHLEVARIAFLAGRRAVVQLQHVGPLRLHRPQPAPEPEQPAVQVVAPFVGRQRVGLPVEAVARPADAVGISPDQFAEEGRIVETGARIAKAQHHLHRIAGMAAHAQPGEDPAQVEHLRFQAAVRQAPGRDFAAIVQPAERSHRVHAASWKSRRPAPSAGSIGRVGARGHPASGMAAGGIGMARSIRDRVLLCRGNSLEGYRRPPYAGTAPVADGSTEAAAMRRPGRHAARSGPAGPSAHREGNCDDASSGRRASTPPRARPPGVRDAGVPCAVDSFRIAKEVFAAEGK